MYSPEMMVALIHWRIKPDPGSVEAFLQYWRTQNTIGDKAGLVAEFLSSPVGVADFPLITWHLDPESLGDSQSFVTVGVWAEAKEFEKQIKAYFNDDKPLLEFEKYRRRRVLFNPVAWRVGGGPLPQTDSPGVI